MQLLLFIKMQNPSPLVKIGIIALSRNIVCNRARSCSKGEGQQEAIDFPFPTDGCPRAEQWTQWDTQWQSCSPKPQGQTTCSMFALTCGQNIPVVLRTLADRKTANESSSSQKWGFHITQSVEGVGFSNSVSLQHRNTNSFLTHHAAVWLTVYLLSYGKSSPFSL